MKTVVLPGTPKGFTDFAHLNHLFIVEAMSYWAHARPGRKVRIESLDKSMRHGPYRVTFSGVFQYSEAEESWESTDHDFFAAAARVIDAMGDLGEQVCREGFQYTEATLGN